MAGGELALERDALEDLGLGLFAEAVERGDPALRTGGFKFFEGRDPKFVVQLFDLLRAETRDRKHVHKTGGNRGFQLLVVGQPAGGDEDGDLLLERVAETLHLSQALFGDERFQRFGKAFEGARGVGVGPGLEGVFALQFQEHADLLKDLRHIVFGHGEAGR
jgi:hypothetical protein